MNLQLRRVSIAAAVHGGVPNHRAPSLAQLMPLLNSGPQRPLQLPPRPTIRQVFHVYQLPGEILAADPVWQQRGRSLQLGSAARVAVEQRGGQGVGQKQHWGQL